MLKLAGRANWYRIVAAGLSIVNVAAEASVEALMCVMHCFFSATPALVRVWAPAPVAVRVNTACICSGEMIGITEPPQEPCGSSRRPESDAPDAEGVRSPCSDR